MQPDINIPKYTQADLDKIVLDQDNAYKKDLARSKISDMAGDALSILGTTSDAVQLLLVAHCELITAIAKAATVADIKAAAAKNSLATEAVALLAGVADGSVKFTSAAKGQAAVIADVKTRATAVSNVLSAV